MGSSMGRRKGSTSSAMYVALLEAASKIIDEEGCQAVTTSRLANEVDLSRHIVHYYFGTIEDVFIGVIRYRHAQQIEQYKQALAAENPLNFILFKSGAVDHSVFEYIAMSLRSEKIRAEIKKCAQDFRDAFTHSIDVYLQGLGVTPNVSPELIGIMVLGIARTLLESSAIGLDDRNEAVIQIVQSWIKKLELTGEWPA